MKKLLIVLIFVFGSANAEQWLTSKNSGGGDIILTQNSDPQCSENSRRMYSVLPNGVVFYGCWTLFNEKFHIRFDSGSRYVYEATGWEVKGTK